MNSKIVVITGASRGLGRAMAEEFMRLGHVVAGCSRSAPEEAAQLFKKPSLFKSLDVRDPGAVEKFAQEVVQQIGPPDLLINNAAIINRGAPLWDLSPQEFTRYLEQIRAWAADELQLTLPE